MNPQTQNQIFLRLSHAAVSHTPKTGVAESEFRIEIGRDDVIGLAAGIIGTILVQMAWRSLRSRPAPWWKSGRTGRIQIADLPEPGASADSDPDFDGLRCIG